MFAAVLVLIAFVVVAVIVKRAWGVGKTNMALLAEMTVLREENARLREQIDELQSGDSPPSTESDRGISRLRSGL